MITFEEIKIRAAKVAAKKHIRPELAVWEMVHEYGHEQVDFSGRTARHKVVTVLGGADLDFSGFDPVKTQPIPIMKTGPKRTRPQRLFGPNWKPFQA